MVFFANFTFFLSHQFWNEQMNIRNIEFKAKIKDNPPKPNQKMRKTISKFELILLCMATGVFFMMACHDDDTKPKYALNLEVYPEGAGNVTGAGEYQEGEQVNISATGEGDWEFQIWTGDTDHVDEPGTANTTLTMPSQSISLTATFLEASLVDIDDNVYQTVIIGNQEWMAQNLRVSKYNNGDAIPTELSGDEWYYTTQGAYAVFDHNFPDAEGINSPEEMLAAYGKLYNWYAVDDPRGLCPEGWSVPGDDDWTRLVDYIVSQGFPNEMNHPSGAGNALKSCRQVNSPEGGECDTSEHPRWEADNTHFGFDTFGFSAYPGGYRSTSGNFFNLGKWGPWWSSTEDSSSFAWFRDVSLFGNVYRGKTSKSYGFSLRCVKDDVRNKFE